MKYAYVSWPKDGVAVMSFVSNSLAELPARERTKMIEDELFQCALAFDKARGIVVDLRSMDCLDETLLNWVARMARAMKPDKSDAVAILEGQVVVIVSGDRIGQLPDDRPYEVTDLMEKALQMIP
jgi:hypothetical protein